MYQHDTFLTTYFGFVTCGRYKQNARITNLCVYYMHAIMFCIHEPCHARREAIVLSVCTVQVMHAKKQQLSGPMCSGSSPRAKLRSTHLGCSPVCMHKCVECLHTYMSHWHDTQALGAAAQCGSAGLPVSSSVSRTYSAPPTSACLRLQKSKARC